MSPPKYRTFAIIPHHCSRDGRARYDASLDPLDFLSRPCCREPRTRSPCVDKLLHSNYSPISLPCDILFASHPLHPLLLCLVRRPPLALSFQPGSPTQSNQVWAATSHEMQLQYCAEIELLNIATCGEVLYPKATYHCNT